MTLAVLAKITCLAWSIYYGRPALSEEACSGRSELVLQAAVRHAVDPVLMLAIDVQECDLRPDASAPVYRGSGRRRVVVGYDHCPMGVRIMGTSKPSAAVLYDLAAKKLARWHAWCKAGHPGGKYRGRGAHHFVAHYNPGNPTYSHQVLAFAALLRGRSPSEEDERRLTERSREIARRLARVFLRRRQS